MIDQSSTDCTVEKCLLELLDPNISPEKALLKLSSPCLRPDSYTSRDNKPVFIFLAYMRFIMTRRPDGCMDGIWEVILKKTVRHSRFIAGSGQLLSNIFRLTMTYSPTIFTWVDLEMTAQMMIWLREALSTHHKCPNPYIRLELFRLLTMVDIEMNKKCLCKTLINTMCEINPHCFYTSGDEDGILFDVTNLNCIIVEMYGNMVVIISSDDHKDLNGARFISNILQMIGVFTVMANSNHVNGIKRDLLYCCIVLNTFLQEIKHIVSLPPIRPYLVEAICELTAAVINTKEKDGSKWINGRDGTVADLGVCSKSCDLPRLLLLRQVQGPRQVHQHSLLIRDLYPLYNDERKFM